MLNDPDSYHGDGNAGDEAREDFDFEAGEKHERRRRPRTAAILFSADPRVRSAAAGIRDNPFSSRIIR